MSSCGDEGRAYAQSGAAEAIELLARERRKLKPTEAIFQLGGQLHPLIYHMKVVESFKDNRLRGVMACCTADRHDCGYLFMQDHRKQTPFCSDQRILDSDGSSDISRPHRCETPEHYENDTSEHQRHTV